MPAGEASGVPWALLDHWNLEVAGIEALAGGEVKDNWLVDANGIDLVLRVYPATVSVGSVEQEVTWTAALAGAVPEIPQPVSSRGGQLVVVGPDGRSAVLSRFVAGHPPDQSPATRTAMAELLGRIHTEATRLGLSGQGWFPTVRRFDWSSNPWWDLPAVHDQLGEYPGVRAVLTELETLDGLLGRLEGLPECLVHNDFHRGNLIAEGTMIVGVVDWDWAAIDWRLLDVAAGMRSWVLRPDTTGWEAAVDFVDAYERTAGGLTRLERLALPDILYIRSLWTCFYDLGRAVRGHLDESGLIYRLGSHEQLRLLLPGLPATLAGD